MAIIQGISTDISPSGKAQLVTWAHLNGGDEGAPFDWVIYADRCIQVSGTFAGASVSVLGSNDGENWAPLSDPQGNALTFSSAKIEQALELPRYVKPLVSGAVTTADLTVSICIRKA